MRFSIITPSFRSSDWLRLCVASVADQGVELEHIIQDACSDDGTQDWLPQDPRVRAFIEKDSGMYDAINRGLRRACGEIVAYLNCDEQYLPGTLEAVGGYFKSHPGTEVAFGDAVVVDPAGGYLCSRPALLPGRAHTRVSGSLAIVTCATFFRRELIERRGLFFDTRYRVLGDVDWVLRILEQRVPMGLLGRLTSAFTNTGDNLSLKPEGVRERRAMLASAPPLARALRPWFVVQYRLRKLAAGHYSLPAFEYALFTRNSPDRRVRVQVPRPTAVWKG